MRCNNCGWDNPANTFKCEKCNAPMKGSMVQDKEQKIQGDTLPETIQGANPDLPYLDNPIEEIMEIGKLQGKEYPCPHCAYPIPNGMLKCPNCKTPLKKADNIDPIHKQGKDKIKGTAINRTDLSQIVKDENIPIEFDFFLVGFLVSFSRKESGEYWPLKEGNNNIGKSEQNHIVLCEKTVSDNHAVINISRNETNDLVIGIGDNRSTNGVIVNGKKLFMGSTCEIKQFDKIKIGSYELLLIVIDKKEFMLSKNKHFMST